MASRPQRSWPGKLRPPSDPGDRVDVSDALSGACTGKAPGWQAGPNGRGRGSCAHPGTLVTRSTFPELYPVLAPERPPDGKPAPTFLAATLCVVLLQPVAVGLLNLLRPPSKVRAQAPSVTPEPALVNHAEFGNHLPDLS